mgnify:CR=1 FL=1
MRVLIGSGLMLLGFIFGVMYDQNMVVLPLRAELHVERERNDILKRALDLGIPNKFKQRDAIWTAVQEVNRASR